MMKRKIVALLLLGILFYSCSASTDTRYENEKKDDKKEIPLEKEAITENFDFTPYRTELDIPKKNISIQTKTPESEIWYGYDDVEPDTSYLSNRKIIDKVQGYRVLVLATDNLQEANDMKSEINLNTNQKAVYVIFDPPFYKVMVGDFIEHSEAKDLSFKLSQLGYTEARVVNETVNIFE